MSGKIDFYDCVGHGHNFCSTSVTARSPCREAGFSPRMVTPEPQAAAAQREKPPQTSRPPPADCRGCDSRRKPELSAFCQLVSTPKRCSASAVMRIYPRDSTGVVMRTCCHRRSEAGRIADPLINWEEIFPGISHRPPEKRPPTTTRSVPRPSSVAPPEVNAWARAEMGR